MDELAKILGVLLKKVSYQPFLEGTIDCMDMEKNISLQALHGYMPFYSDTEIRNMMEALEALLGEHNEFLQIGKLGEHFSVFDAIFHLAEQILIKKDNEVTVRYEKMLRWRMTTKDIGEEILITAFLARNDLKRGSFCRDFSWPFVIGHNNVQLQRLTGQGMAENHFHLWGSAPYFHITWIWMMNHVEKLEKSESISNLNQNPRTLYLSSGRAETESDLKKCCLQAALIRLFLFAGLYNVKIAVRGKTEDADYNKLRQTIYYYLTHYEELRWHIDELQSALNVICQENIDYMLSVNKNDSYEAYKENHILTGEREFLYEMFRRIEMRDERMDHYAYNLFYVYLLIKEKIRGEMIQTNEWVGFENFSIYQRRSGTVAMDQRLENLKAQMAVMSSLQQKVVKLELRITPFFTAEENAKEIRNLDEAINSEKNVKDLYYYVMHFIKKKDDYVPGDCYCNPRHMKLRAEIKRKTIALLAMREKYPMEASRILGIDAASQEIGCRPEVFAQGFRTLHSDTRYAYTVNGFEKLPQLRVTYHVGEDFLDVTDGLRAIDEAIHFLNMDCGDRIGHGLALGVDVAGWYENKRYCISLPKQDYLDNIVWLYHAIRRFSIEGMDNLKSWLEKEFYCYFEEVYSRFISNEYIGEIQKRIKDNGNQESLNFDIHSYYDAWKLRGDAPELYEKGFYQERLSDMAAFEVNKVNRQFPKEIEIRKKQAVAILYHYYHYDANVRKVGRDSISKKVSLVYVRAVAAVQKAIQREVAQRGIGIETNPSSNVMIGTFDRYEEHPITAFYNNGLTTDPEKLNECPQIWVSINTDDQGVFNIKLENEYALLARALEKKKDENGNAVYKKSMIFDWLDRIRKMGLEQSFLQKKDVNSCLAILEENEIIK